MRPQRHQESVINTQGNNYKQLLQNETPESYKYVDMNKKMQTVESLVITLLQYLCTKHVKLLTLFRCTSFVACFCKDEAGLHVLLHNIALIINEIQRITFKQNK